jgi:hypothetical protein
LSVLNNVFAGVSKMQAQLEAINVTGEYDKVNMSLARTIRLGVRTVRLEAEKVFDAKRDEVQREMMAYKTEDTLWLKTKQIMQALTKQIEADAKWKEETRERIDAERFEARITERLNAVLKYNEEMTRNDVAMLSDAAFKMLLEGLEKQHNDRIEAERKAEEEQERLNKIAAIRREREMELRPYYGFYQSDDDIGEMPEKEYKAVLKGAKDGKDKHDKEQERVRAENIRLQKAAAEKEKEMAAERAKVEAERKQAEAKALQAQREAAQRMDAERRERERITRELEDRKAAEAKAIAEQQEREQLLSKAPDKTKLGVLALQIEALNIPDMGSKEGKQIIDSVQVLLNKTVAYIREKMRAM